MKIIDTHQHLWDLSRFPYSWCTGYPLLYRTWLPEDYDKATQEAPAGAEIAASVHVEADVDSPHQIDEVEWLEGLAAQPGSKIKALVASGRPESEGFEAHLQRLAQFPLVKGIRRVLHVCPDETSQAPLFAENIRLLPAYDYTFDICMLARQLPLALNLIRQCPETRFVLDHCGNPDVQKEVDPAWRKHIQEIAACPNVVCKVSGIVAGAVPGEWKAADLRPFIEHVIQSFGWDRVMWGSYWPVCLLAAQYGQWLQAALEITQGADGESLQKLFHDNAVRVYRLEV